MKQDGGSFSEGPEGRPQTGRSPSVTAVPFRSANTIAQLTGKCYKGLSIDKVKL